MLRSARSTPTLFVHSLSLALTYMLALTLCAPFMIRPVTAAPQTGTPTEPVGPSQPPAKPKGGRRAGELIVRFREDVTEQDKTNLIEHKGGRRKRKLRGESRLEKIDLPAGQEVDALAAELSANPAVELVEPNYLITRDEKLPDDERFAEQWALANTGQAGGQPGADISGHGGMEAHHRRTLDGDRPRR